MNNKNYREQSRLNWVPAATGDNPNATVTDEQLRIGCLQRIADATEKMTKGYTSLEEELNIYKQYHAFDAAYIKKLEKANAALRGHVKRMKKSL